MKPEVPRNAIISNPSESYRSGDKVTFECKEGFNQEGIATQMCFQGSWTVLPFKCSGNENLFWYFSTNLLFYFIFFRKRDQNNNYWEESFSRADIFLGKCGDMVVTFFDFFLKSVHLLVVKGISVALWKELFISQSPFLYRFQPVIGVFVNP